MYYPSSVNKGADQLCSYCEYDYGDSVWVEGILSYLQDILGGGGLYPFQQKRVG